MAEAGTPSGRAIATTLRTFAVAGRTQLSAWTALSLLGGLLPLAVIVAVGGAVGAVPDAVDQGPASAAGRQLLLAVGAVAIGFAAMQAANALAAALDRSIGWRVEEELKRRMLRTALAGGLLALERPDVQTAARTARTLDQRVHTPVDAVAATRTIVQWAITGVLAGVALAQLRWWAPFAVGAGWLLQDVWGLRQHRTREAAQAESETLERARYFRSIATEPWAAKEVRVFALGPWALHTSSRLWKGGMESVWTRRRAPRPLVAAIIVSQLAGGGIVFLLIAREAVSGTLSLGLAVVCLQSMFGPLSNLIQPYAMVVLASAAEPIAEVVDAAHAASEQRPPDVCQPLDPVEELRLEGVRFRYPGARADLLDGVDLTLRRGRSLAIVGANGSGKSTLVKLLARLYEPSAGRVFCNGEDLLGSAPERWRRQIAVVFQDHLRLPLTIAENVALTTDAPSIHRDALESALREAGLHDVVARYPRGADQLLGRAFGGTDLSGGQWQRLALARAFYAVRAGARVLILDEPTAHLDVDGETEMFDRVMSLSGECATVLVSHRFATVRHADEIAVLHEGRIAERGSHDALIALGGRYARMFELQAAAFTGR